jgi:hypothetical protein
MVFLKSYKDKDITMLAELIFIMLFRGHVIIIALRMFTSLFTFIIFRP